MKLVFFSHPPFLGSLSMPRFSRMLIEGMKERGHRVDEWVPTARFYKIPVPRLLKKWMGYADQYIAFPTQVRRRIRKLPQDTLFVFTDHALGPWVPLVADRPHVIHCHDFLAQHSAMGLIAENPTSSSGRAYQKLIRSGFSKGKNFISVSNKTRQDLAGILLEKPVFSETVYNGLNQEITPLDPDDSRSQLSQLTGLDLRGGYLLHVGGNQWYKNRTGVIEIFDALRAIDSKPVKLLLAGTPPSPSLFARSASSPFSRDIHFLTDLDDASIRLAYAGASVFLFPSLAEGFGWPIAEAMASGCPVVTTGEAPMTEVAGDAATLIPRQPLERDDKKSWASQSARTVCRLLAMPSPERANLVAKGVANASRFDPKPALDRIESIYQSILKAADHP